LGKNVASEYLPWAQALFAAAGKIGARAHVANALEAAAAAWHDEAALRDFFRDPRVTRESKAHILAAFMNRPGDEPCTVMFERFSQLLFRKGRGACLPDIASAFQAMLDRDEGVVRISVRSARPFPPDAVNRLCDTFLALEGGKRAESRQILDAEVLGGFVLSSGSIQYDYSVASTFERLRAFASRAPRAEGTGSQ
jgi:F-type H+-transporting ATPase subunit delta